MNTTLDEQQSAIRDLAAEVLSRQVDQARIEEVGATADRFDRELWSVLADAGLLGVAVPEHDGGLGLGMVELALVLDQFGRTAAPVPLLPVTLAAAAVAAIGSEQQKRRWLPGLVAGSSVVAVAVPASTVGLRLDGDRLDGDRLTGTLLAVPWAHVADAVLVPVAGRLFLVEPSASGVTSVREETTSRVVAQTLTLNDVAAETLGDAAAADWLWQRTRVALAAVQAGVTAAALAMTATYTSDREQFGKPLSTFQAVALKAADAYLDTTAIRATALQAAWAIDNHTDAALEVLTAAWWAAEAGQHCVHLTQHLHGGMGADVTYPVHRYFLWGKQIELMLGGASALLAELGDALAGHPDAGDAVVL